MNLQEKRSTLVEEAGKAQQLVEQYMTLIRRIEGAVSIIDEQLAEQTAQEESEDGITDISSTPDKGRRGNAKS